MESLTPLQNDSLTTVVCHYDEEGLAERGTSTELSPFLSPTSFFCHRPMRWVCEGQDKARNRKRSKKKDLERKGLRVPPLTSQYSQPQAWPGIHRITLLLVDFASFLPAWGKRALAYKAMKIVKTN